MEFKEGNQWKCCFDPQKGLYTAQIGFGVNCTLYEITKEIYENVDESDDSWSADLIREGRRLFMSVNDKCGLPYTVVLDADYEKLCPWSDAMISGKIWDEDFTDSSGDQAQSIVIAYELIEVGGELFCDQKETTELRYFSKENKPQLFTKSHDDLWDDIFR